MKNRRRIGHRIANLFVCGIEIERTATTADAIGKDAIGKQHLSVDERARDEVSERCRCEKREK